MRKEQMEVASIAVRRRDTFRIQEDITLPANKPNVDRLLWKEMRLRGVNTRPLDGKLLISGDLMIFLLYVGEGENIPVPVSYTHGRRPVKLVYWEVFSSKQEAMRREAAIKRLSRSEKEVLVYQFAKHQ